MSCWEKKWKSIVSAVGETKVYPAYKTLKEKMNGVSALEVTIELKRDGSVKGKEKCVCQSWETKASRMYRSIECLCRSRSHLQRFAKYGRD